MPVYSNSSSRETSKCCQFYVVSAVSASVPANLYDRSFVPALHAMTPKSPTLEMFLAIFSRIWSESQFGMRCFTERRKTPLKSRESFDFGPSSYNSVHSKTARFVRTYVHGFGTNWTVRIISDIGTELCCILKLSNPALF